MMLSARAMARWRVAALAIRGRGSSRRRLAGQTQTQQSSEQEQAEISTLLETGESTSSSSIWVRAGKLLGITAGAALLGYGIYQQMPSCGNGAKTLKDGELAQNKIKPADQRCAHFTRYIDILERKLDKMESGHKEEITRLEDVNRQQAKRILELERARKWTFWPF